MLGTIVQDAAVFLAECEGCNNAETPISAIANVAAYWAAIQKSEHAAKVLFELHRGMEERRKMICNGRFERLNAAAQKEADAQK